MRWQIPAKTFLIGEYAAVLDASAILLTTSPCFEMELTEDGQLHGIHVESPAGKWWTRHSIPHYGLSWHDPYHGQGGVGASSAQFLGAYMASCHLLQLQPNRKMLLDSYFECAWRGEGLRPSGYDVIAQTKNKCVYINRHNKIIECLAWPFKDLAFLLLHSGQKLATHYHLQSMALPDGVQLLSPLVEQARVAFAQADSQRFIYAINSYQDHLAKLQLMARHSLQQIELLKKDHELLAAKGCGAMGADVLLIIIAANQLKSCATKLTAEGWTILASSDNLYTGKALLKNNLTKTLEILS